jgi:hypothetical protein
MTNDIFNQHVIISAAIVEQNDTNIFYYLLYCGYCQFITYLNVCSYIKYIHREQYHKLIVYFDTLYWSRVIRRGAEAGFESAHVYMRFCEYSTQYS